MGKVKGDVYILSEYVLPLEQKMGIADDGIQYIKVKKHKKYNLKPLGARLDVSGIISSFVFVAGIVAGLLMIVSIALCYVL